jgi:hypothetical protein
VFRVPSQTVVQAGSGHSLRHSDAQEFLAVQRPKPPRRGAKSHTCGTRNRLMPPPRAPISNAIVCNYTRNKNCAAAAFVPEGGWNHAILTAREQTPRALAGHLRYRRFALDRLTQRINQQNGGPLRAPILRNLRSSCAAPSALDNRASNGSERTVKSASVAANVARANCAICRVASEAEQRKNAKVKPK